jgi:translocation and assembly module TamA
MLVDNWFMVRFYSILTIAYFWGYFGLSGVTYAQPFLKPSKVPLSGKPSLESVQSHSSTDKSRFDIIDDRTFENSLPVLEPKTSQGEPLQTPLADPLSGSDIQVVSAPLPERETYAPISDLSSGPDLSSGRFEAADLAETRFNLNVIYNIERPADQRLIKSRFEALSVLIKAKGKVKGEGQLRLRIADDQALLVRIAQSLGYFDAVSLTQMKPSETEAATVLIHLTLEAYRPYLVASVNMNRLPAKPELPFKSDFDLKPGMVLSVQAVKQAEAQLSLDLPQNGYPFAKIGERDIALSETDDGPPTGDYSLKVATGLKSQFGGVRFANEKTPFDQRHLKIFPRFKPNDIYDSRKTDDLRAALMATNLFSSVKVDLKPQPLSDSQTEQTVDLLIEYANAKHRSLSATIGYATGEGASANFLYQHRAFAPPEGQLNLEASIGEKSQGLNLGLQYLNYKIRDLSLAYSMGAFRNDFKTYDAYTAKLGLMLTYASTPLWQKLWTGSLGFGYEDNRERSASERALGLPLQGFRLFVIPVTLLYDHTDDLLNPSRGYRLGLKGLASQPLSGQSEPQFRLILDSSLYYPVSEPLTLAARLRLGLILGVELSNVRPSQRFYSGGGGSVRGFNFQSIGSQTGSQVSQGGLGLTELSLEARYRFKAFGFDLGVVTFVDMGQIYPNVDLSFKDLRIGYGIGARLYTTLGPIRFDVATPLKGRQNEPSLTFYVGIGQSF